MSPRILRAKARLELGPVADALGLTVPDLRILEATRLGDWPVQTLTHYAAVCGYRLRITATRPDGREDVLQ